MILLTSTADVLQAVLGLAGVPIDVHASWVDNASTVVTPGRTNTAIVASGLSTIVPAPAGATTKRNVKTLHLFNKHASSGVFVSIQHNDGAVIAVLFATTLGAGDAVQYTDQGGWSVFRKPS